MRLPQFDSTSIFAAILDERKGGFFKIASLHEAQHKQMYLPDSNVLLTRFLSHEGVGEVVDFMPVQASQPWQKDTPDRSRRAGGTEIVTNEMPAVRAPPEIP